jgi:hypothetical protein
VTEIDDMVALNDGRGGNAVLEKHRVSSKGGEQHTDQEVTMDLSRVFSLSCPGQPPVTLRSSFIEIQITAHSWPYVRLVHGVARA